MALLPKVIGEEQVVWRGKTPCVPVVVQVDLTRDRALWAVSELLKHNVVKPSRFDRADVICCMFAELVAEGLLTNDGLTDDLHPDAEGIVDRLLPGLKAKRLRSVRQASPLPALAAVEGDF